MKIRSLPSFGTRYWAGMLIASLAGTTLGDFVSTDLHFGFVKGLLPLSFILAAVFVAEWKTKFAAEVYYWAAIVLTRTMATNLADLATHSLKLDYAWLEVALFAFLMVIPLSRRRNVDPYIDQSEVATPLSNNGVQYWMMILVASVIGTTLGDLISDKLGLGVVRASIFLGLICVIVLLLQLRLKFLGSAVYWGTLIIVRTTGTVWGDFLSGEEGLNLGFMASAAYTTVLLVCVLRLWRPSTSDAIQALACDNEGEIVAVREADQPKLS